MKEFFQSCLVMVLVLVAIVVAGVVSVGGGAILVVILAPLAVITAVWILVVCIGARISGGKVDLTFNVGKKAKNVEEAATEKQEEAE